MVFSQAIPHLFTPGIVTSTRRVTLLYIIPRQRRTVVEREI
jgi:hypothetical protein